MSRNPPAIQRKFCFRNVIIALGNRRRRNVPEQYTRTMRQADGSGLRDCGMGRRQSRLWGPVPRRVYVNCLPRDQIEWGINQDASRPRASQSAASQRAALILHQRYQNLRIRFEHHRNLPAHLSISSWCRLCPLRPRPCFAVSRLV